MNIRRGTEHDIDALVAIWRTSVRATHDFLSDAEIQSLEPVVRDQALPALELWVLCSDSSEAIGFMGLQDNSLAALFVSPAHFGKGGGRQLLELARKLKGSLLVDVNEQNPR